MSGAGLLEALDRRLGPGGLLTGEDAGGRYESDWSGLPPRRPLAVARPRTDAEVAEVLRLCAAHGRRLVVQGGRTGVVGAAVPLPGEIVLSLERMARIGPFDPLARTVVAEAGVTIEALQDACEAQGLFLPLDLGSRGSATVGGAVATNAGGNRVLRYGMTRELVLGLDAVLADGTWLGGLRGMLKNNTGYDLKQLFIGSEGTLGVVTRALFRLRGAPAERQVAFMSLGGLEAALELLPRLDDATGGLSAFEAMWPGFYGFVLDHAPNLRAPLPRDQGLYILAERLGPDPGETFAGAVSAAMEAGLVEDAVLSRSETDARALWAVRDGIGPASGALKPFQSYDVGFERGRIAGFVAEAQGALAGLALTAPPLVFGHLGDGNIHVLAGVPQGDPRAADACDEAVYGLTHKHGGTISAEHGIGIVKRAHLRLSRSEAEVALMRRLKAALDPAGILGRGRILEVGD